MSAAPPAHVLVASLKDLYIEVIVGRHLETVLFPALTAEELFNACVVTKDCFQQYRALRSRGFFSLARSPLGRHPSDPRWNAELDAALMQLAARGLAAGVRKLNLRGLLSPENGLLLLRKRLVARTYPRLDEVFLGPASAELAMEVVRPCPRMLFHGPTDFSCTCSFAFCADDLYEPDGNARAYYRVTFSPGALVNRYWKNVPSEPYDSIFHRSAFFGGSSLVHRMRLSYPDFTGWCANKPRVLAVNATGDFFCDLQDSWPEPRKLPSLKLIIVDDLFHTLPLYNMCPAVLSGRFQKLLSILEANPQVEELLIVENCDWSAVRGVFLADTAVDDAHAFITECWQNIINTCANRKLSFIWNEVAPILAPEVHEFGKGRWINGVLPDF